MAKGNYPIEGIRFVYSHGHFEFYKTKTQMISCHLESDKAF